MKLYLFVLYFVLNTINRAQCNTKYGLQSKNKGCHQFKCSPIADPVCVRMGGAGKLGNTRDVYIEAINMCEVDYMRCYKDLKISVVPIDYCIRMHSQANTNHTKVVNRDDNSAFKTTQKKRVKREPLKDERDNLSAQAGLTDSVHEKMAAKKGLADSIIHEKMEGLRVIAKKTIDEQEEVPSNEDGGQEDDHEEDAKEFMCPTYCRIKKVMVCARCDHGSYKTFPSVCHMRSFSCSHPDEKLQLIARYPCAMSAPYIQNNTETLKALKPMSVEEDLILKHLICKYRLQQRPDDLIHVYRPEVDMYCQDYMEQKSEDKKAALHHRNIGPNDFDAAYWDY